MGVDGIENFIVWNSANIRFADEQNEYWEQNYGFRFIAGEKFAEKVNQLQIQLFH